MINYMNLSVATEELGLVIVAAPTQMILGKDIIGFELVEYIQRLDIVGMQWTKTLKGYTDVLNMSFLSLTNDEVWKSMIDSIGTRAFVSNIIFTMFYNIVMEQPTMNMYFYNKDYENLFTRAKDSFINSLHSKDDSLELNKFPKSYINDMLDAFDNFDNLLIELDDNRNVLTFIDDNDKIKLLEVEDDLNETI